MNRQEAEAACQRLAREHPERNAFKWLTRQSEDGNWSVVKVRLPEHLRRDQMKATVESKPEPPAADDPRSNYQRDVGTTWVG
jgi:hypothetical protein